MNAVLATSNPLPSALSLFAPANDAQSSAPRRTRRSCVSGFRLVPRDVDRFNALLADLGRSQAPFDCDQLATAGRELCNRSIGGLPGIGLQMRRAAATALMVADPAWDVANDTAAIASQVVGYVRAKSDLVPDQLPRIGRMDDAIVVDTAWPRLAGEVGDYLDYRRLRRIEARLRGCEHGEFEFTRAQWEQAHRAESELATLQRQVRNGSYLPASTPMFQIH